MASGTKKINIIAEMELKPTSNGKSGTLRSEFSEFRAQSGMSVLLRNVVMLRSGPCKDRCPDQPRAGRRSECVARVAVGL